MPERPQVKATSQENAGLLSQADAAAELAADAFAAGNPAVGIAALQLSSQLLHLARIRERMRDAGQSNVPR